MIIKRFCDDMTALHQAEGFADRGPSKRSQSIIRPRTSGVHHRFGMHRFNLQAEARGDVLPRYLGSCELLVAEDMGSR